jgi:hypothetical protein
MEAHELASVIVALVAERVAASVDIETVAERLDKIQDELVRTVQLRVVIESFAEHAWETSGLGKTLSASLANHARDWFTAALSTSLHDRLARRATVRQSRAVYAD